MIIKVRSNGEGGTSQLAGRSLASAKYEDHQITEGTIRDMFWESPQLLKDALGFEVLLLAREKELFENKRRIDMLGIAQDGSLVVFEFKRGSSSPSALKQALAYAAACRSLSLETIQALARENYGRWELETPEAAPQKLLEFVSLAREEPAEAMNDDQQIVLLGRHIDPETAAVAAWLYQHEVKVTCVSLPLFCDQGGTGDLFVEPTVVFPPVSVDSFFPKERAFSNVKAGLDSITRRWQGEWSVNTDERDHPGAWKAMLQEGVVAVWSDKYGEALSQIDQGQTILAYLSGSGYIAYGVVLDAEPYGPVAEPQARCSRVPADEDEPEYQRRVQWKAQVGPEVAVAPKEFDYWPPYATQQKIHNHEAAKAMIDEMNRRAKGPP